ncbi:MAG: hypothetical protein R3D25_15920 [Geminicoccaceae bacterium]
MAALRDYSRTIELGLQVLQRNGPAMAARATVPAPVLAIVFGLITGPAAASTTRSRISRNARSPTHLPVRAISSPVCGRRRSSRPRATVEQDFLLPGAVGGLSGTVHRILGAIDAPRAQEPATRA